MPELPEVETIRIQLEKYLVGHRIKDIEIRNAKYAIPEKKDLIDSKIKGVRRFAKVLSIDLSNGYSIVIHIKLTGQLIYRGPNLSARGGLTLSPKVVGGLGGKHTHVIFYLDRNGFLYYNDVRRFGWIKVIETEKVTGTGFIGKLGPEPFASAQGRPGKLTLKLFKEILSKSRRPIKILLMDQAKIGGVGNIYANDALWLAGINPKKESKKLGNEEIKKSYDAIHKVLKEGLKFGGASELAFVTPDGSEGEYQKHTLVYGHHGEPCSRCDKQSLSKKILQKSIIQKFFLSGRGTYFCPVCQK